MESKKSQETKDQRFKRVASSRTQRILENLRLLGNCSNKTSYAYSKEDISKIFREVDKEVKRVKILFGSSNNRKFNL